MAEGNRFQQIRDFVVQIRHTSTDAIVGTGFVAKEGIVTCAHVVRDAGVDPRGRDGQEVGVYYPEREGRPSFLRRAKVAACFDQHDDDVVLLHLVDGSSPLGPELFARFGQAKESELHDFLSFGYRRLQNYQGLPAYGKIIGHGGRPAGKKFQGEPLMLNSQNIDRGMSGAPVLDTTRNLIVGVVYLAWDSAGSPRDRDTGFAVDAIVLSLEPLGLSLEENDLPRSSSPSPKIDLDEARGAIAIRQKVVWNNVPPSLSEWTGREQLLKDITSDWIDARVRITGLIGFGGEGKSSLAREWVDQLLADSSRQQPEGVFWWGFYENRNVDQFFDAALNYLGGGRVDVKKIPSANMKAQIIAAMLGAGRYLFILDGLEVLQYQDGDMYGSIKSPDLKAFLEFFASPDHESFCMVTSRAPLMDMISLATYKHRDVDRLNQEDGRKLLQNLGVRGEIEEIDRVVRDWDGHALTLSLLGSYLRDHHGGNISHVRNIPPPTAEEPRYERVHRMLRRYDEHLDEAAKAFLKLFSAFRRPVERDAFDKVFRIKKEDQALNAPIVVLDDSKFQAMVDKLVAYRILRYESKTGQYTAHPLIRAHYFTLLTKSDRYQAEEAHSQIKDYYLARAKDLPYDPTLEELAPLFEVVHHACKAGIYEEAYEIYNERINQSRSFLTYNLGAYNEAFELISEFFQKGDVSKEPLIGDRADILNAAGICLESLGKLKDAIPLLERSIEAYLLADNFSGASVVYENLAQLYAYLGVLDRSEASAKEALRNATYSKSKAHQCDSIIWMGWASHLSGKKDKAHKQFQFAEKLRNEYDFSNFYLWGILSKYHAEYLFRNNDLPYARQIANKNLEICNRKHWQELLIRCHRILGDIDARIEENENAKNHYDLALKIAYEISEKSGRIEALTARGRWTALYMHDSNAAIGDLNDALDMAMEGGYRPYEADIRIGLAWAHLAAGNGDLARGEAGYALQMSQDMGYYWGIVDAKEVLAKLDER